MATTEQLKALMRAHMEEDDEKFNTVALQIAAHEAMLGHTASADDIKNIIQKGNPSTKKKVTKIENLIDALEERPAYDHLSNLVLSESLEQKIQRVILEFRNKDLLGKNGLKNRSKILLVGPPGTGKTMTAAVIANEICLPLYVIQLDKLVTKYMGETSVKLRRVFDYIEGFPAVYLFDEFDALGADRSLDNDVGEMRRILNSFLQFFENEDSCSLIIAATNNPDILDKALFRRFDDVLEYDLPDMDQILRMINNKLGGFCSQDIYDKEVIELALGLNHSDIAKACEETLKSSILKNEKINKEMLEEALENRKELYQYKGA